MDLDPKGLNNQIKEAIEKHNVASDDEYEESEALLALGINGTIYKLGTLSNSKVLIYGHFLPRKAFFSPVSFHSTNISLLAEYI